MVGFIVGLVWFLIAFGNSNNFPDTANSVHDFLVWWYIITSIIAFFSIFLLNVPGVTEEISNRHLKGMYLTTGQCIGAIMVLFVISRFLIFIGLDFIRQSVLFGEMVKTNQFTTRTILFLLGALIGGASLLPLFTFGSLANRG